MTEPMTQAELDAIDAAEKAATPGPWMWDMRSKGRIAQITTAHSGRYYVMGFERWGLQDACPSFQVYDRYEGPVTERGSQGMVRADKLARPKPNMEHRFGYDDDIDHPDARFMIISRTAVPRMRGEIERLKALVEQERRRAEAAEQAVKDNAVFLAVHGQGGCAFTNATAPISGSTGVLGTIVIGRKKGKR